MKIPLRLYPFILLATFLIFVLLGILLGFRPEHGGNGHRSGLELSQAACLTLTLIL